ncbi:hypothetical protein [Mycobacterium sp. E787]|uniref:hypothetical protein n=1 Tax=Mycobacterium sp. E787 TaxID=1834150 RepID=UPI000800AC84|nr:hypothetical protein [Mycobacterium sp. E787]OBI52877.1 hypothetical protein A5705_04895 [Mycobacterium sp. E787]
MPTYETDKLTDHVQAVRAVAAAGATIPPQWQALTERLAAVTALDRPMQARLTAAIIDGTDDDVPQLFAAALAEQAPPGDVARVVNALRHLAGAKLRELYAGVAVSNYGHVAKQYNVAAKGFGDAASGFDPETSAVDIAHHATEKQRKSWLAAEQWSAELTRLAVPLAQAAALAGVRGIDRTETLLPLLCAPTEQHHRRHVWTAFTTTDPEKRCGRWSALHALGVEIRALPSDELTSIIEFAAPPPLEVRHVQIDTGVTRREVHDPCDPGYQAPLQAERGMVGGRMTAW